MKRISLALVGLIMSLSQSPLSAQDLGDMPDNQSIITERGVSVFLLVPQFMTSSPSNLNTLLGESGYPIIPLSNFNWGLGAQYRTGQFNFGFDLSISRQRRDLFTDPDLPPESRLTRSSVNVQLYSSYYVFEGKWWNLFPFVAFSSTDANLYLSKQQGSSNLNTLLSNPGTSTQLDHFSVGLVIGLGIDLQNKDLKSSAFESLKFGYRVPLEQAYPWESTFATFNDAPADQFGYFIIQLALGGAFNWKKRT